MDWLGLQSLAVANSFEAIRNRVEINNFVVCANSKNGVVWTEAKNLRS
jgi:hypothetical protein